MNTQALMVVVTISVVTVLLRVTPFVAIDFLRSSVFLRYLGKVMPVGVMALLVGYSLLDVDFTRAPYGLPEIVIMMASGVLYWRTRNPLLSIGSGLAAYVTLASLVF